MSLDVGTLPEVHLALEAGSWDDPPGTAWPRPPDADSDSWESGPPAPPRDSPSPPIDAVEPNRAGPAPDAAPPSGSEPEAQLELFQKLGFSLAQVRAVMAKLGLRSDTDRVLGELVRAGCEGEEGAGPQGPMGPPGPLGLTPWRDGAGPAPQSWAALSACQADPSEEDGALRPVVLDGSNVAMSHGNKEVFSCLGIQLAVNYFLDRGHTDITVFVPSWRKEQPRPDVPITDQHLLRELERRRIVVFTPSRRVAGKRVACHDDRFIVKLAHDTDGVIVSNDTYRDLQRERAEWRRVIEERLLMYSFVNDKFMPPDDPLGRHGPTLDNFLRRTPRPPKRLPCPYGKKCTYGLKCRFSHPERGTQSQRALADELRDRARTPATAPSPGPAPSPPLEEVLRRKLTLGQRRGSLRRAQTSENVPLVKGQPSLGQVQPSGSRKCEAGCRRAPSGLDRAVERAPGGCCCPDCLDSGLGSYESRPSELHPAPSDTRCHEPDGRRSHGHCYSPSPSPPCSCCPPPRHAAAMGRGLQHTSLGLSNPRPADVMAAYRPPHYASYVPYGPAPYSVPHVYPHARAPPPDPDYWSEPYGVYRPQAEGARWPPHAPPSAEREQVRKKLLGIFNARLVERAMELFPHEVDPQVLTAEIFTLRSQEGLL